MEKIFIIITFVLLLPGLIGVLIPVLPGIPYMFVVVLMYGFLAKFQALSSREISILGLIALASLVVDYLSGIIGAKYGGAARRSLLWGMIGTILGIIVFPPFGSMIGLFVGIFASEILSHNDNNKAVKAASAGVIGSLTGIIINFILAITFLVMFLIFAL